MIIQVVIAAGLVAGLGGTLATLLTFMYKETRALNENYGRTISQLQLSQSLVSFSQCDPFLVDSNFSSGSALNYVGTPSSTSPLSANLVRLPGVERGQPLSSLANSLLVDSGADAISLVIDSARVNNLVSGKFVVKIDQDKLVRNLARIEVPILLTLEPSTPGKVLRCAVVHPNDSGVSLASLVPPPPPPLGTPTVVVENCIWVASGEPTYAGDVPHDMGCPNSRPVMNGWACQGLAGTVAGNCYAKCCSVRASLTGEPSAISPATSPLGSGHTPINVSW